MGTKALLTAEQFAQMKMGETEDFELVEGELIPLASGTPLHAWTRDELCVELKTYLRRNPIGLSFAEMDCTLLDETVRRPDFAVFLHKSGRRVSMRDIPISWAPDIAIEVLSPSESALDVSRKVHDYLSAGCCEVWNVDRDNHEVIIRTRTSIMIFQNDDSIESPLLPGFRLPLEKLFASPE